MSSIEKAVALLEDDGRIDRKRQAQSPHQTAVKPKLPAESLANAAQPEQKADVQPEAAKVEVAPVKLNFKALNRARYLTPAITTGRQIEEYRLLKRQVLLKAKAGESADSQYQNLVAITSAVMGEGKTFTAFNLAMSIAMEWNRTVLLVDCDLVMRSLTYLVGLHKAPGLTDGLLDERIHWDAIIRPTNVAKLWLVPAGQPHARGAELLASQKMQHLAHDLSALDGDRIVLFDAPPLLSNAQAVVLTSLVGQILLVVEEGKTSQKNVKEAIALLEGNKTGNKTIGIVLNKAHGRAASKYYYKQ